MLLRDVQEMQRLREEDVSDRENFDNLFVTGRKVLNTPTSSTDVSTNRENDFNWDSSYLYVCTLSGSTLVWLRSALSTF